MSASTQDSKMTPESFCDWLTAMKDEKRAENDAACAKLLGVSANSIVTMKKRGADRRTALACSALLDGLEPYAKVR